MKLTDALKKSGVSCMVYGESGIGKTHFSGTFPGKTLIIAAEANGIKTLDKFPPEVKDRLAVEFLPLPAGSIDQTSAQYNKFFDELIIQDLPYDNIVLDSATELSSILLINRTDVNKNGGSPTQKNYNDTISSMKRYLRILRDLSIMKGKNVIILALEAEIPTAQTEEGTITSKGHPAMVGKKFISEAEGLFDIVAHMEKKSDGTRFLRLEGSDTFVGKDRFGRKYCKADGAVLISGKVGNETEEK